MMAAELMADVAPKSAGFAFRLPANLEASEPPEARGLARDEVRLMVTYRSDNRLVHACFREVVAFLREGDVVVINTSGTRPAAIPAWREGGETIFLHFSTQLPTGLWLVELRSGSEGASQPFFGARAGETIRLPGEGQVVLKAPYGARRRLWLAQVRFPDAIDPYLKRYGKPIRYAYVDRDWPARYYQTVYANEAGSAEMPSAGRPFTPEIITQLAAHGVYIAPVVLHTGVASLEAGEQPYEEAYYVPAATARLINMARASGGRVVAVGTTVVRALETVADEEGRVRAGEGWTGLVVTPARGVRSVDGLLTGWHEPQASHLQMLEALAGKAHVAMAYGEALREAYLWHEFGDLHLILP